MLNTPELTQGKVNEMFRAVEQIGVSVDGFLEKEVTRAIHELIPPEVVDQGFDSFVAAPKRDNLPSLEVSILTKQLHIYDLVFSYKAQIVACNSITPTTHINLRSFYPSDSSDDLGPYKPYRAELTIVTGISTFKYEAEGNRRLVQSLISYGLKCSRASSQRGT